MSLRDSLTELLYSVKDKIASEVRQKETEIKNILKPAIEAKGITVSTSASLEEYAEYISDIYDSPYKLEAKPATTLTYQDVFGTYYIDPSQTTNDNTFLYNRVIRLGDISRYIKKNIFAKYEFALFDYYSGNATYIDFRSNSNIPDGVYTTGNNPSGVGANIVITGSAQCIIFPKSMPLNSGLINFDINSSYKTLYRGIHLPTHAWVVKSDWIKGTIDTGGNVMSRIKVAADSGCNVNPLYLQNLSLDIPSLETLIENLYDAAAAGSTTSYKLVIGEPNLVLLSEEYITKAEEKGWTIL